MNSIRNKSKCGSIQGQCSTRKNISRILRAILCVISVLFLLSSPSFCSNSQRSAVDTGGSVVNPTPTTAETTLSNPGEHIKKITDAFQQAVGPKLAIKFWDFARGLFAVLAIIEVCWACADLALMGSRNLHAVTAMIGRQAITIGICYMILYNGMTWLGWIVEGIRDLGGQVTGRPAVFSPAEIFKEGAIIAQALWVSASGFSESIMAAISIAIINIVFAAAATLAAIALIQSYFVIAMALFFLGLGGMRWTRDSMTGALRHSVAIGVKLMTMAVLTGVMLNMVDGWRQQLMQFKGHLEAMGGALNACLLFSGTSVIFFGLMKALPDYMASIAGVSVAGSNGLEALIGGVAGGAMGAAAPQILGRAAGAAYGGIRGGLQGLRTGGIASALRGLVGDGVTGAASGLRATHKKFAATPPSISANGMGPGR